MDNEVSDIIDARCNHEVNIPLIHNHDSVLCDNIKWMFCELLSRILLRAHTSEKFFTDSFKVYDNDWLNTLIWYWTLKIFHFSEISMIRVEFGSGPFHSSDNLFLLRWQIYYLFRIFNNAGTSLWSKPEPFVYHSSMLIRIFISKSPYSGGTLPF